MKKTLIVIEPEDAQMYRETLIAIRKRLIRAFQNTEDMSLRKWINHHGTIVDDLIDELKLR